jgi:hypothetical protein
MVSVLPAHLSRKVSVICISTGYEADSHPLPAIADMRRK